MLEADRKFPKLAGHGERTASYAVTCAHALGIPLPNLQSLRIAAALHFAFDEVNKECPCCSPSTKRNVELSDSRAADYLRSMYAEWNMAPTEASILFAACRHDLKKIGLYEDTVPVRPGVVEALQSIDALITPLYEI
jgi:hypothetical protein